MEQNTIKEMIIFHFQDSSLTLYDIFEYIKGKQSPFKLNIKDFYNLELNVFSINETLFSFEINGIYGEDILRNPIIYKNNGEFYEFIALEQIKWFLKKYSLPMIECIETNDKINVSLLNLKIHLKHGDKIIECFKYNYYENEEQYKYFFINHKTEFINIEFKDALDFDKNFNYYFNLLF